MSNELKKVLTLNVIVGIILAFINLFVNLYIWEKDKEIFDIALFSFSQYLTWSFSYTIGTKILYSKSLPYLMKISATLCFFSFFLLTFLHIPNKVLWIVTLGVIFGATYGIYTSGMTQSLSILGKGEDYIHFLNWRSVFNNIISIFIPLTFALVISKFGYYSSFVVMILLTIMMFIYSFFVPNISLKEKENEDEKLFEKFSYRNVFSDHKLKLYSLASILGGFFVQFQSLFLLIYTFSITDNKIFIGLLNVLYAILSVATMQILKRTKNKISQFSWLYIGLIFTLLGFIIAMITDTFLLLLANILLVIGIFLFSNIYHGQHFIAIENYSSIHRAKILIWREALLCYSRAALLLFVLIINDIDGILFFILFITAFLIAFSIPNLHKKILK